MERLLLLGLNHTTAPLEVRERVAFNVEQQKLAITTLRDIANDAEFALLSTCNRVEIYAHGAGDVDRFLTFVSEFHGLHPDVLRGHTYRKSGRDVVDHLFRVASSLDSMVLGETQILGQVREAYERANVLSATGAMLNPLFQRAIRAGREVMRQTSLGDGRWSVASVAVDYAKRIFDDFSTKTVLCVGAGKMTRLVLESFAGLGTGKLLVSNRDPAKAADLARRFGGTHVEFGALNEHIIGADIVISSTGSVHPIICREGFDDVLKRRRFRPIFLIDLAVPRDVEPAVGGLEHVYLCNLDDLQGVVSSTQSKRTDAIASASALVDAHVEQFVRWNRTRERGPAIDDFYKRYHAAAQEELARTLNKLPDISDSERAHLEELARRIVNKLLHDRVRSLGDDDSELAPVIQEMRVIDKLFNLSNDRT